MGSRWMWLSLMLVVDFGVNDVEPSDSTTIDIINRCLYM